MAEYNIPNKYNYMVPAGATVFIAKITSGVTGEYRPVGNLAGDCNLGFELTRLENKTNLWGINTRDRNVVISKAMNFSMVINELVRHNLEYALGSSTRTANQTVAVPMVEKVTFAAGTAQVNSGSAIASVIEVQPNSGEDTYDEGATGDYTVTLGTGTITLTGTSDISNGDTCIVIYTVNKTVTTYPIMDDPNLTAAIMFVARLSYANDVGNNICVYIPSADIALDGDIPLPKETWPTATLKGEALPDETNPTGALGYWYNFQT